MPFLNRLTSLLLFLSVASLLGGCFSSNGKKLVEEIQSGRKAEYPSLMVAEPYLDSIAYSAPNSGPWWENLEDEVLNQVIETALENSWDIRVGAARIAESQAFVRGARAARLPSLSLEASHLANEQDIETNKFDSDTIFRNSSVQFNIDWQMDVFGRARANLKSSKSQLASIEALQRDLQRLVVSQVTSTYLQLRSVQALISLTKESEERRSENLDRIKSLLEKGYATALDFSRSQSQVYQAKASIASLEANEIQLVNQLSILIGQSIGESRSLLSPMDLATPPSTAPQPSPLGLLLNRPDLRAVEFELLSAAFNVQSAKASLYPTLSLSSQIGSQASELGRFPSLDQLSANLIGNLAAPILGRGRLLAGIDSESARLQGAHARYERAIHIAVAEVDTALMSFSKNQEIFTQRQLEASSAREAAELSRKLFSAGELDFTSVIVAEQTRSSAEVGAISAQRDTLLSYVNYVSAVAPIW